jgi:arabinose-5-phosphate isomerase
VTGEDGKLAGIITDGDLRRHMADNLVARLAGDVMTKAPKTVRPNTLAAEALRVMNAASITTLFVVAENGQPAGILHIHDCLRAGVA